MSVGDDINLHQDRRSLAQPAARPRFAVSVHSIGFASAFVDLAIIIAAAIVSASVYHALFLRTAVEVERYAAIGAICFLNFVVIGAARKSYQIDALLRFRHQVREVILTWTLVAMLSLSLIFAAKVAGDISRGAVALFFLTGVFALLGWRRLLGLWMTKAIEAGTLSMKPAILIADRDELIQTDAVHQIRRTGYSPTVTLTYGPDPTAGSLYELAQEALRATRQQPVDSIILMANWNDAGAIDQILGTLRILPLSVRLLPDHRTARLIQRGRSAIAGLAAVELQRAPLTTTERAVKRAFDVTLASIGLVLLSPLFAIVPLLIKSESRGPVFFRQTRIGFNGRQFRIFKFRSMSAIEDGADLLQATRDDPRATHLGRWLRKTNIDELPQLWNILKGDMSIVGPRPHAVAHDVEYQTRIGSYAFRHHVKPGLTGWAQVNGLRGETKTLDRMERRVEHDLYYINEWSFFLDVLIVLLTIRLGFHDPAAF